MPTTQTTQYVENAAVLLPTVDVTHEGEQDGVHTFQVRKGETVYRPTFAAATQTWSCTCRDFRTTTGTCTHVELVKLWRAQTTPPPPAGATGAPPPPPKANGKAAPTNGKAAKANGKVNGKVAKPANDTDDANVSGPMPIPGTPDSVFPVPVVGLTGWSVAVAEALLRPFPAGMVGWKAQTVTKAGDRALAVAYVDARAVQDRLDETVGPDGWSDEYRLLSQQGTPFGNEVVVQCRLTVLGITKTDVGTGEDAKSAYSDAFKRVAVKHGVGRYIYSLPLQWVDYDPQRKQLKSVPPLPRWAQPR